MMEELLAVLSEQGCESRVVPVEHLADIRAEYKRRLGEGLIDPGLRESYLSDFSFSPPARQPEARSIIVVAVPQPQYQVTFNWDGEPLQAAVPPTYPERLMDRQVGQLLRQVLEPAGYWLADALLPKKLLAVRSGLAAYGKNNITYVPGIGSYFGLVTAYSDLPAPDDYWREARMMERCENCASCLKACPASAITSDRFLLHAERCISFHNEKPGDIPFPAWLDLSWLNCLVGCLHCQRVCPENKDVRAWVVDGVEFSQEETAMLLERVPLNQLPAATSEKMKRQHLDGYFGLLPRNLEALLGQSHGAAPR